MVKIRKIPRLSPRDFSYYPLLLLLELLLPPLLVLVLELVAGEDTFFNRSYQKDEPWDTAAAVIPNPSALSRMNIAHPA
jgi:hypothetical protein